MKKNMGSIDRILRTIIGLVFIVLYVSETVTGGWGIVLLAVAVIFIGTSLMSRCPLYLPFGCSTSKEDKRGSAGA